MALCTNKHALVVYVAFVLFDFFCVIDAVERNLVNIQFFLQYQCIFKQTGDENKDNHQLGHTPFM